MGNYVQKEINEKILFINKNGYFIGRIRTYIHLVLLYEWDSIKSIYAVVFLITIKFNGFVGCEWFEIIR